MIDVGLAPPPGHLDEEMFRQFGEASSDSLWIIDARTCRLEYLSPAFETMWGISRAAVMGDLDRWADCLHPGDRERVLAILPRALMGERISSEYRIVRPDGEVRWIFDVGFPIRDAGGTIVRAGGIAQDLTERRRAEKALSDNEQWLRILMEGIPQLVWRAQDKGIGPGQVASGSTSPARRWPKRSIGAGWMRSTRMTAQRRSTPGITPASTACSTPSSACAARPTAPGYGIIAGRSRSAMRRAGSSSGSAPPPMFTS
jgi:PAS domain S-box-containing protein